MYIQLYKHIQSLCHTCSILQLVLPSLPHLVLPDDLEQRRTILQLQDKPVVRATVLEFMKAYLLLPYG